MPPSKVLLITRLHTQNAGNEALSKELIGYLRERLPDAEIRALDRYPRSFENFVLASFSTEIERDFDALALDLLRKFRRTDASRAPFASADLVTLDGSAREMFGPIKNLKRKVAVRRRLASWGIIEAGASSTAISECAAADLVVWNPAGEIHPTGSADQVMRLLLLMRIAQLGGARTAVVNHSLEIDSNALRRLIAHVYSKIDYVGVRDAQSVRTAEHLGLRADKIYEAPDIVFLASRKAHTATISGETGRFIGIAVNGLQARSGFDEWKQLMTELLKFGRPLLYLSNAMNHDVEFARGLASRFGGTVIDRQPGYEELRKYFRSCDVLISSRLHSSILALCEGTPVVSIEPSVFKLTAIFDQMNYPLGTESLHLKAWSRRLILNVEEALRDRERLVRVGALALLEQTKMIDAAYSALFELNRTEH